jgi:hypothetical protein
MSGRLRRIFLVAIAIALLAGCDRTPAGPAGPAGPASGQRPTQPVVVTFETPDGFAASDAYRILVPLYLERSSECRFRPEPMAST